MPLNRHHRFFIDEIISIGIAIVDAKTFEIKTAEYFLVPEELIIDGFNNGNITIAHTYQTYFGAHKDIENHIRKLLNQYNITNIYTFIIHYSSSSNSRQST